MVSRTVDGRTIVDVTGEVDVYTAPTLREKLSSLVDAGHIDLVVNLTEVRFMDSTGLHALIQYAVAPEMRGRLTVTNGSPQVRRLFQVSGVGRYLSFASPPRTPLRVIAGQGSTTRAPR